MTTAKNKEVLPLVAKLLIIQKECSYLKKENKGYQFQFVSSAQTLGTIRGKMDELGVLLVPKVIRHSIRDFKNSKGNNEFLTEMDVEFTWINVDDPTDILVCPFYGQGVDNAEKGVGKALTYSEKYFLLKFFHIATDKDDPDNFQKKHGNNNPPPTPPPDAPTPPQTDLNGNPPLDRNKALTTINEWLNEMFQGRNPEARQKFIDLYVPDGMKLEEMSDVALTAAGKSLRAAYNEWQKVPF